MEGIIILIALGLIVMLIILFSQNRTLKKEATKINDKYKPIMDLDKEIDEKKMKSQAIQAKIDDLSGKYKRGVEVYRKLEKEVKLFKDDIEMLSFGVYEPIYDFETSEEYKTRLNQIKERQKQLIKDDKAAICTTTWQVGGSAKQGEIMIKRYIKLSLRAFNGECDSLISKVKWNNIIRIEERIKRAFEAINNLGKSNHVFITDEFFNLKIEELRLTHEYEQKRYEEKEIQRMIREEMREEEKAQREMEKAQKEAEAEEKRFEKALEKAKKELASAHGENLDKLNEQIQQLERELQEAHEQKERAISRAQMTKSGHVYIISNIGSFGEQVYKIGMTRRLEPMDRVKELGDASVPFQFDVHAMIYSENAPELENTLHQKFSDRRVNMINLRREYFKVTLKEIEEAVKDIAGNEIEFTRIPEAQEYRETMAILRQISEQIQIENEVPAFPEDLF
ncbi:MAG: DUF4041 domain-containing protein [Bacteroidia bacterium]